MGTTGPIPQCRRSRVGRQAAEFHQAGGPTVLAVGPRGLHDLRHDAHVHGKTRIGGDGGVGRCMSTVEYGGILAIKQLALGQTGYWRAMLLI